MAIKGTHTITVTAGVMLECDECGSDLELTQINEVENVLTIKMCDQCLIKKATKMAKEFEENLREKIETIFEDD